MENITHSLMGATLAELAMPAEATPAQRRIFLTVGIVAANLPDADLLYTSISPAPLGYLLHHRGHTHTLVGLVAQALLLGGLCMIPAIRRRVGGTMPRLWMLVATGLLSHLVLDSWNSYGVHPFWPVSGRWFYGDAIFIADPWLWTIMGVAAVLGMRSRRGGIALGAAIGVLILALERIGMISSLSLLPLGIGMVALSVAMRPLANRRRATVALALVAVYVAAMFGVRERVDGSVRRSLAVLTQDPVLDVILSPHGANPLCWTAYAITANAERAEYSLRGGTSTVIGTLACEPVRAAPVMWDAPVLQSTTRLRDLARRSCRVRAWLQFGRAPVVGDGAIADYRFGRGRRDNFSAMPLDVGDDGSCPPNLPTWGTPRADLVSGAH